MRAERGRRLAVGFRQQANPHEPRHEPAEVALLEDRKARRIAAPLEGRHHGAARREFDQAVDEPRGLIAGVDGGIPASAADRARHGELGRHRCDERPPRDAIDPRTTVDGVAFVPGAIGQRDLLNVQRPGQRNARLERRGCRLEIAVGVARVLGLQSDPDVNRLLLRDLDAGVEGNRRSLWRARCDSDGRADGRQSAC